MTLIDLIVGTIIITIIASALFFGITNGLNKIDHGVVIDKEYHAGYSTYRHYHPEEFTITIQGEKKGKVVEYTFNVPESEYEVYKIGDWYPKE